VKPGNLSKYNALSKIGERWLKSTFIFSCLKVTQFSLDVSEWLVPYSAQLSEEIAVSFQMTKLFVNARGENFAVIEVFSRNLSGFAEHCLANAAVR